MANKIAEYLSLIIQNEYLLVAILSVIPVTEIKGAVLYAAVARINLWKAFLAAFAASAVATLAILPLFPLLLRLAERSRHVRRVTSLFTERLQVRADRIVGNAGVRGEGKFASRLTLGLFAFVAVPLPFTGVWAGALLAALMRLDYKNSVFALIAGNFTAGGIVLAVSLLAGDRAALVLNVFLCLALAILTVMVVKAIGKRLVAKE